jgi:excisionase family DNA binding protein
MTGAVRELLDELGPDGLREFARALRPYLDADERPVVYTPATLAAELGLTARAIRAAIERGDLEARRSGRGWVIGTDAVARWATPERRAARRSTKTRSRPRSPLRDALGR